jgi:hypothetical protein
MQELKRLLPVNLVPVQSVFLEDNRSGVPSPISSGQDRPLHQGTSVNETRTLTSISVPAHTADSFESQPFTDPTSNMNHQGIDILALHSNLTLVRAEIFEQLFSTKARQRPIDLSANVFRREVAKLEIWGRSSPLVDADTSNVETLLGRSGFIHAIMLEALLFEASYQLHAVKALCGFAHYLDAFSPENLRTGARMVWPEIYLDAQRLLKFAALISEGPMIFTWLAW